MAVSNIWKIYKILDLYASYLKYLLKYIWFDSFYLNSYNIFNFHASLVSTLHIFIYFPIHLVYTIHSTLPIHFMHNIHFTHSIHFIHNINFTYFHILSNTLHFTHSIHFIHTSLYVYTFYNTLYIHVYNYYIVLDVWINIW